MTPFTYPDTEKQEKNEAGHKFEKDVLDAFKVGEDAPGGVQVKLDRKRAETGRWFIETSVVDGPEKYLLIGGHEFGMYTSTSLLKRYLKEHPSFDDAVASGKTVAEIGEMFKVGKITDTTTSNEVNVRAYLVPAAQYQIWAHQNPNQ